MTTPTDYGRRGRHRVPDEPYSHPAAPAPVSPAVTVRSTEQTAVIPAVDRPQPRPVRPDRADQAGPTAVMPAVSPTLQKTDETSLMGIVPPAPVPSADDKTPPKPPPRPGEQVVPLRAVRTKTGGYRSIHSALTRTTLGTAVRTTVRGLGEVLIALGAIVLLLAAYEVWGKAAVVASRQNDLDLQLSELWDDPPPVPEEEVAEEEPDPEPLGPPPGEAIARLYIPAIGKYWVVVEGVELDDIRYAPGRYPTGAMPGQVGNFAVAGHRNPATFWDLDKVHEGDMIVVETRDTWYAYQVTGNHIVAPDDVDVVAPVPGDPEAEPVEPFLTLTTCNPKWDNYERLIVHAKLAWQEPRTGDEDRPDVLSGLGS